MKKLNLGCGNRFLKDWANVDFISHSPFVKQYNLTKGIPFQDNSFELVYHSHVLEHFSKEAAIIFIKECNRVLVPGGWIRIAVPDLEMLAKIYIEKLQNAIDNPDERNVAEYQWSVIEFMDQMVRTKPGGEMFKIWTQEFIANEHTITKRLGQEFISFREQFVSLKKKQPPVNNDQSFTKRIKNEIKKLFKRMALDRVSPEKFRVSGEIHQWMYDRFSLKMLLEQCGFAEIHIIDAYTTIVPGWDEYIFLDQEKGLIRKPDSLFVEAVKQRNI